MVQPDWYGLRYPTLEDLEVFTEQLGAGVVWTRAGQAAFDPGDAERAPAIYVPRRAGPLEQAWLLAHELGHLVQHAGPRGELLWSKDETQADRWAALALIPAARIEAHGNASLDAFIAALSAHFEDLPYEDCPQRRLAAWIAEIRLRTIEEVA